MTLVHTIDLRAAGAGCRYARGGFSPPEPDHCWGVAPASHLALPSLPKGQRTFCLVRINDAFVTAAPDGRDKPSGEVVVRLGSRELLRAWIGRGLSYLAFELPEPLETANETIIVFQLTGHASPQSLGFSDPRNLTICFSRIYFISPASGPDIGPGASVNLFAGLDSSRLDTAIRVITSLPITELMIRFESLGHSCDFGLVQRELGLEPIGLLRFSSIDTARLVDGILASWEGVAADRDSVIVYHPEGSPEFWTREQRFGITSHTFIAPEQAHVDQVLARELYRLPFLARKFSEDVENGEKIFVLRRPDTITNEEALGVWLALNINRPNALLYVNEASSSGSVTRLMPYLYRGSIEGLHGNVAPHISVWKRVCANAWLMFESDKRAKADL